MTPSLTFSYSVSETVDRHEIDGISCDPVFGTFIESLQATDTCDPCTLGSESKDVNLLISMFRFCDNISLNISVVDCSWCDDGSCSLMRRFDSCTWIELLRDEPDHSLPSPHGECRFSRLPIGLAD